MPKRISKEIRFETHLHRNGTPGRNQDDGYAYCEMLVSLAVLMVISGTSVLSLQACSDSLAVKQFKADTDAVLTVVLAERMRLMSSTPREDIRSQIYFDPDSIVVYGPDRDGRASGKTWKFGNRLKFTAALGSESMNYFGFNLNGSITRAGSVTMVSQNGKFRRRLIIQPINSLIYLTEIEQF